MLKAFLKKFMSILAIVGFVLTVFVSSVALAKDSDYQYRHYNHGGHYDHDSYEHYSR